ncbi:MAG: aminotransferase class III-fold pyridoxal phosphate-dependent enzyme, partial [Candidatus Sulfotelmatobacter sp.]
TTRDEIAAAFQPGDHLSTFGGNPVSCAAALANIQVIEEEHLCERARQQGEGARAALKRMLKSISVEADVRGLGLMIGIELVTADDLTPAPDRAEAIRESCRKKGVLVGVGGIYGNVLRIQPPLVISKEHLDQALHAIGEALEETTVYAKVSA